MTILDLFHFESEVTSREAVRWDGAKILKREIWTLILEPSPPVPASKMPCAHEIRQSRFAPPSGFQFFFTMPN